MNKEEYESNMEEIEEKLAEIKDIIARVNTSDLSEKEMSECFDLLDKANSRFGYYIESNNNYWGE